jgi:hypothetical protein
METFEATLRSLGWIEGRNVELHKRLLGEDAAQLAKELVALMPDILVASPTSAVLALRRETETIPIVFIGVSDGVARLDARSTRLRSRPLGCGELAMTFRTDHRSPPARCGCGAPGVGGRTPMPKLVVCITAGHAGANCVIMLPDAVALRSLLAHRPTGPAVPRRIDRPIAHDFSHNFAAVAISPSPLSQILNLTEYIRLCEAGVLCQCVRVT